MFERQGWLLSAVVLLCACPRGGALLAPQVEGVRLGASVQDLRSDLEGRGWKVRRRPARRSGVVTLVATRGGEGGRNRLRLRFYRGRLFQLALRRARAPAGPNREAELCKARQRLPGFGAWVRCIDRGRNFLISVGEGGRRLTIGSVKDMIAAGVLSTSGIEEALERARRGKKVVPIPIAPRPLPRQVAGFRLGAHHAEVMEKLRPTQWNLSTRRQSRQGLTLRTVTARAVSPQRIRVVRVSFHDEKLMRLTIRYARKARAAARSMVQLCQPIGVSKRGRVMCRDRDGKTLLRVGRRGVVDLVDLETMIEIGLFSRSDLDH